MGPKLVAPLLVASPLQWVQPGAASAAGVATSVVRASRVTRSSSWLPASHMPAAEASRRMTSAIASVAIAYVRKGIDGGLGMARLGAFRSGDNTVVAVV